MYTSNRVHSLFPCFPKATAVGVNDVLVNTVEMEFLPSVFFSAIAVVAAAYIYLKVIRLISKLTPWLFPIDVGMLPYGARLRRPDMWAIVVMGLYILVPGSTALRAAFASILLSSNAYVFSGQLLGTGLALVCGVRVAYTALFFIEKLFPFLQYKATKQVNNVMDVMMPGKEKDLENGKGGGKGGRGDVDGTEIYRKATDPTDNFENNPRERDEKARGSGEEDSAANKREPRDLEPQDVS